MADKPQAHVVHLTPVRLRLRIPDKQRDTSFFVSASQQLSEWPIIDEVEINPVTASILIHCTNSGACMEMLKYDGPFSMIERDSMGKNLEKDSSDLFALVRRQFASVDEQVQRATGGLVSATSISVVVAVGLTVAFQIARGRRLSAAATLLLFTGRTLQRWWTPVQLAGDERPVEAEQVERALIPRQLTAQFAG